MSAEVAQPLSTREEAQARADAIREKFSEAWEMLGEAYLRRDWIALEFATWDAYCEALFSDVRQHRLPVAARRAIVKLWTKEYRMSANAAASGLGTSPATVKGDRKALLEEGELTVDDLAEVISLDDRRRRRNALNASRKPAETVEELQPPEGLSRAMEGLWWLAHSMSGLNSIELSHVAGWDDRPGLASGVLSKLEKRGLAHRNGVVRGTRGVYVAGAPDVR